MSRIRYLLDENTPHVIRDRLLQRRPEVEVLVVGDDVGLPYGISDVELLNWIEKEGYILVSRNRRTLPQHLRNHLNAGAHVPSIFLLRRQFSVNEVIEDLILIWELSSLEEW